MSEPKHPSLHLAMSSLGDLNSEGSGVWKMAGEVFIPHFSISRSCMVRATVDTVWKQKFEVTSSHHGHDSWSRDNSLLQLVLVLHEMVMVYSTNVS